MPMPQHCIDCDKVASVLDYTVPYCADCYMREMEKREKEKKLPKSKS